MIRCYKYWAVPASADDNRKLHEQCRLAGDYRRALVDIENRSRAVQRALWAWPMRAIAIPDRKAWRENGGDETIKAWTQSDEYKQWRDQFHQAMIIAGKAAYAVAGDAGLAWGTRLVVAEAVEHARRTTAWIEDLGNAPCNRVAVQIQSTKPLTNITVFGEDGRLRIGRELYALGQRVDGFRHVAVGDHTNRSGQLAAKRMQMVSIRTSTVEGTHQPIFTHLHMLMHRQLPAGQIKYAWAQRRNVGGRWHWEVVFSIAMGEQPMLAHRSPMSTVGVDVGWRRVDTGMRVAFWYGGDAQRDEVVIPIEVERRKSKSADLRSIRDNNRNALAKQLKIYADARAAVEGEMKSELVKSMAYVLSWTRISHFIRLERVWADEYRTPTDEVMYAALQAFLKQDHHLHLWEAHNLTKMQRQIRGRLTTWAHQMCKAYGVVAVEKLDLVALKEEEDPARINARAIQRLAPGEVVQALKMAAGKYGTIIHEIDAAFTTLTCSMCKHTRHVHDQSELMLKCDECLHVEDQDLTAARNILNASTMNRDEAGLPIDPKKRVTKKLGARRTRKRQPATTQP